MLLTVLGIIRRYSFLLIFVWLFLGILWVFIDSRKVGRKREKSFPPFVWLIICICAGIWAIPIYRIVRKPRRKSRIIMAILCYWGFLIISIVIIMFSQFHRKSVELIERQVVMKEVNIGMTKENDSMAFP